MEPVTTHDRILAVRGRDGVTWKVIRKRMQCKDVPDGPVLLFLHRLNQRWANWFGDDYDNSVTRAMPPGTPGKLVLAKMRQMMNRGVVDGCPCGCRGDFVITDKGEEEFHRLYPEHFWSDVPCETCAEMREACDVVVRQDGPNALEFVGGEVVTGDLAERWRDDFDAMIKTK